MIWLYWTDIVVFFTNLWFYLMGTNKSKKPFAIIMTLSEEIPESKFKPLVDQYGLNEMRWVIGKCYVITYDNFDNCNEAMKRLSGHRIDNCVINVRKSRKLKYW